MCGTKANIKVKNSYPIDFWDLFWCIFFLLLFIYEKLCRDDLSWNFLFERDHSNTVPLDPSLEEQEIWMTHSHSFSPIKDDSEHEPEFKVFSQILLIAGFKYETFTSQTCRREPMIEVWGFHAASCLITFFVYLLKFD